MPWLLEDKLSALNGIHKRNYMVRLILPDYMSFSLILSSFFPSLSLLIFHHADAGQASQGLACNKYSPPERLGG